MARIDPNNYNTYEEYLAAGGTPNKVLAATYGTNKNTRQATNAGSNSMSSGVLGAGATGDFKDTEKGKLNMAVADTRDKLGVEYGKTTDPQVKQQIADQLNKIDQYLTTAAPASTPTSVTEPATTHSDNNTVDTDEVQEWLNKYKGRTSFVDDYYHDRLSDVFSGASKADQKILLLDAIGTMLKNAGQSRSYIGTAFNNRGAVQQSRGPGDDKSLIQQGVEENWKKGLERRNTRLDKQLEHQMDLINFPDVYKQAALNMHLTSNEKVRLMYMLADMPDSVKKAAFAAQNPYAAQENIRAWIGTGLGALGAVVK